ncbi:MAG: YceI family protein [Marinomonas sp.]
MFKKSILVLSALLLSTSVLAQWKLDTKDSTLNYVSTKMSKVVEVNSFQKLEGSITDNGELSVDIDLASVETNVPIRNARVKALLFDVTSFSKANISAVLDPKSLSDMKVGETYTKAMSFNLSLHGIEKEVTANIRVVKLADDRVLALSASPIVVYADEYKLTDGIEKLREAAKLPSISTAVPVTFSLIFDQE